MGSNQVLSQGKQSYKRHISTKIIRLLLTILQNQLQQEIGKVAFNM